MDTISAPAKTPLLRRPRRELAVRICLTLLVMVMPLAVVYVLTSIMGLNMFRAVPIWGDETWWFAQYAAMSKYGRPLGYFGYAGTHAAVGTFAAWGMYPTLVIGLLARVFGWSLHAFVYYNFALLAGASLIFILLAKPNTRSLILLAVTNSVSYITLAYGLACMNEVVRYSMAIVLAGIMYRIITVPKVSRFRFILRCTLVPLLLVYALLFYAILAAFIPIYIYAMLHRLKPWWRLPIAALVTYLAIRYLPQINGPSSAPYIIGSSHRSIVAASTIAAANPALQMRVKFLSLLKDISLIDPISLLTSSEDGGSLLPFLFWFCVLLYITMGFLLWRMHATAKKRDMISFTVQGAALALLLCFWGGHILLYTTSDRTFLRGCNTAVICVMFLAAMLPKEEGHVWRAMFITCLAGLFVFLNTFSTEYAPGSRFSTDAQEQAWAEERQQLADIVVLDEDANDPWSNTVVFYHASTEIYYLLPYGVGVNERPNDIINRDAKYVVAGKGSEDSRAGTIQALEDIDHVLIGETDNYLVFENQSRTFD